MSGAIIVRGVERPVDALVHTWLEHRLHFTCRTRTETRVVVNHTTGAENAPERVFENMRSRLNERGILEALSVHFVCDARGELWQFADTEARCSHAGEANAYSIGIEFICRLDNFAAPRKGVFRERVQDVIHGELTAYENLTPAQVGAGIALNVALCREYGLPLRVPLRVDGQVFSSVLPEKYLASFQGCTGHLHYKKGKRDPGIRFLRSLHEYAQSSTPRPVA